MKKDDLHHFVLAAVAFIGCLAPALAQETPAEFIRETLRPPDASLLAQWKAVVTHTHNMRAGELPFQEARVKLVEWCRRLGIAALGVGSPWEPVSLAAYKQYEGRDRDVYYSGRISPRSVMHREEIGFLFRDLNAMSRGSTWFYQDNETPKNRLGHAWWFGYKYDVPAWHDYSQDRPIQYWENDEVELNSITGQPHRRRCLLEIMAVQRKAGAIGVLAHPTSWWTSGDRFITNIASEVGLLLMADGHLDGIVAMGYNACHRPYQRLWFHLLDTGAIVPGFAETDVALDRRRTFEADTTYVNFLHIPNKADRKSILAAAGRGACFMSTGAFLSVHVDGVPMGRIAPTRSGRRHRVRIEAYPQKGQTFFSRLEVIGKGGNVLARKDRFPGGVLEYGIPGREEPHYVVVRAFGQDDDPDARSQQSIQHMAMSNPVYLHPPGFRFAPVRTEYTVRVTPGSAWIGGTLEFQSAGGETLSTYPLQAGVTHATLPASARVQLHKDGLAPRHFYIAMENPRLQELLAYLYRGEFRKDYPNLVPGDVPPAAFRLDEMREALRRCAYVLN